MLTWSRILTFAREGNPPPAHRVERSQEEWERALMPEEFRVTRLGGTERPFSSELCSRFEPGPYACRCCESRIFDAGEKFESGTGWPSFTRPVAEDVVAHHMDFTHGMTRVEVTCAVCDAHLGHVFPDGPAPTGLRYCINALSLRKVEP